MNDLKSFNTYYEIMRLPHKEADLLVGKRITTKGTTGFEYAIELDEYFQLYSGFGTRYTVCEIGEVSPPLYSKRLCVWVYGIDDANFRCDLKPSQRLYLSYLDEQVREFLSRTAYRKVNVHALADFLYTLNPGNVTYDWN